MHLQFMKLLREIKTAVRVGGTNTQSNARLAQAVAAARNSSVPKAKIEAAIFPDNEGASEVLFEAMGPGGVGFLIKAEADNKVAATQSVRRVLTKMNCTLGNLGSVSWMFDAKGVIVADLAHPELARALALVWVALCPAQRRNCMRVSRGSRGGGHRSGR